MKTGKGEKGRFGAGFGAKPPGSLWRHAKTGGWYWSFTFAGKRRSIPLVPKGRKRATKQKGVAEQCRRWLWCEITQDGEKIPPKGMAVWINEFQVWNLMSASERHSRYNADIVRKFAQQQGIAEPWAMTADAIQAYLQDLRERGLAPATQKRHRNALRKFARFLMLKQQLEFNPADQTETERVYQRPPRFLTRPQELRLLFAAVKSPLFAMIVLGLESGLRVSEMIALRWKDIQPGGVVIGADVVPKTYQWRVVPIPDFLRVVLGRPGKPAQHIFPQHGVRSYVRQLQRLTKPLPVFGELPGRRAGNQWHLLRSTFAVNQARAGKTLWELMALLGHANPATTMRYVNIARAAGQSLT